MQLTGRIIKMSLITSLITVFFVSTFPELLLGLVTSDLSVIQDAIPSLMIVCVATVFFSVSMVLLSAVSGTGDTKAAMIIEIINIAAYLIFIILCTRIFYTSVEVVWLSEVQYWVLMGIFSYYYLRSNKWEKQISRAE